MDFKVGDLVYALKDSGREDWHDNPAARSRPWGVLGCVEVTHDSHGECYEVRLEDGRLFHYEREELVKAKVHGRKPNG